MFKRTVTTMVVTAEEMCKDFFCSYCYTNDCTNSLIGTNSKTTCNNTDNLHENVNCSSTSPTVL